MELGTDFLPDYRRTIRRRIRIEWESPMLTSDSFRPPVFLRSAHVQTILASNKFRARGINIRLFPDLYNFNNAFSHKALQQVTDTLLAEYSDYASSAEYFKAYSVLNADLKNIGVPTTIMAAADDPIIPIEDFKNLEINDLTNLVTQSYGGHNGFLANWSLESWYEEQLVILFDEIVKKR